MIHNFSRRRRSIITVAAFVSAAVLSITGCTQSGDTADHDEGVTLDFWNGLTGTDKESVDQLVSDFNASQDTIQVTSNAMPWDVLKQKLLSSVASGDGPDVVSIDTADLAQFVDAGTLQPVDDFYDDNFMDTENLVEAAVDAAELGGERYGIPLNFFTEMLYWNKDIFADAGYDAPPTNWEEFAEMAPNLTIDENGDGTPEQYALAIGDHDTVPMFQPLLWNTGGGVVSDDGTAALLDDPATLEALNFWVDQVREHKVSPIGMNGPDTDALFQSGKAAMELCGPWVAPAIEDAGVNFGVAQTFAGPVDRVSLAGTVSFTVPVDVDEETKQAIYEFAAFWNSKEQQATYSSQTGFPSTRSDLTEADFAGNKYPAIFGNPEVTSNARVYLAGVKSGSKVNDTVFVPALQRALNGEGSVDELFTAAQTEAQSLLDE